MDKSLTALRDLISIKSGRACLPRQARLHAPARQARPDLPTIAPSCTSLALTAFRPAGNEPENSAPQSFLSAQCAVAHA